jgi:hypothetical protein
MKKPERPVHRHPWLIANRMLSTGLALIPVVGATLLLGMLIYHNVEHLGWSSSFLNAAMLLGGMGPVDPLRTETGKWLAGSYALLAGLVVLVVTGVMIAPVIHHVLSHYGFDEAEDSASRPRSAPR